MFVQVMVFVHARNETARTAEALIEMADMHGHADLFALQEGAKRGEAEKIVSRLFLPSSLLCVFLSHLHRQ